MLKAKRKNRVVRIPDEKADEYKALGYTITTMDDRVLSEPEDKGKKIAALQTENEALRKEKAALQAENEALRKEKAALQTENEALRKEKAALQTENEKLRGDKAALQAENAELQRRLADPTRREASSEALTGSAESETETPDDGGTSDAATGAVKKKATKNRASS